ncbi:hypothetical protein VTG60DRAFT_2456 [Thermothelomyces hinnuleus]
MLWFQAESVASGGGSVCGKGWNRQGGRTITYSGTYNATGPGYLVVHGWTRNPLIEYYIVESHGELGAQRAVDGQAL